MRGHSQHEDAEAVEPSPKAGSRLRSCPMRTRQTGKCSTQPDRAPRAPDSSACRDPPRGTSAVSDCRCRCHAYGGGASVTCDVGPEQPGGNRSCTPVHDAVDEGGSNLCERCGAFGDMPHGWVDLVGQTCDNRHGETGGRANVTRSLTHPDRLTDSEGSMELRPPCSVTWEILHPRKGALTVDHLDGDRTNNALSNLVPSCHPCNAARAVRTA